MEISVKGLRMQKKRWEKTIKQLTKHTEKGELGWKSNRKDDDDPIKGSAGGDPLVYSYPFSSKLIIEVTKVLDELTIAIRYNFEILDTYKDKKHIKNLFDVVEKQFVNEDLEQAFDDIEDALKKMG